MKNIFNFIILLILVNNCSSNGRAVDPTVWDDIFDVSPRTWKREVS